VWKTPLGAYGNISLGEIVMTTVLEGTWEEIAERAPELAGRRVRLFVFESAGLATGHSVNPDDAKRRADEFLGWANSHQANAQPLSDFAVSRENMYRDEA
jgi:hypothetical protein